MTGLWATGNSKFYIAVFITVFFSFTSSYAQHRHSLEFSPAYSLKMFTANSQLTGAAFGWDMIYSLNSNSNVKDWRHSLRVKSIDVILNVQNMRQVKVISVAGQSNPLSMDSFGLLAGINIGLARFGSTELSIAPAFGLGFLSETFFTNTNPLVGGHVNFASRAALKWAIPITESISFNPGLHVFHYSNAAYRVPNRGINGLYFNFGLLHQFKSFSPRRDTSFNQEKSYSRHNLELSIAAGRRGIYRSKQGLHRAAFYAGYSYRRNQVLAWSAGVDAIYQPTVFDPQDFGRTYQSKASSFDHWRLGVAAGPDIWMGNLALMLKYGYYLHFNSFHHVNTYWTAGFKYTVLPWIALQAKVFVHQTEADFVGFGLLINAPRRKRF